MKVKNYYEILNISPNATLDEVKKAYRRLALQYHPDRNKAHDAHDKFIEITEAYEVLRDSDKKKEYDNLYRVYFKFSKEIVEESKEHFNQSEFEEKSSQWGHYGKSMAEEYASMPFEDFARRLLKEMSIGVNYIPNLIAMFLTGGSGIIMLFLLPSLASETGGGSVIFMLMFIGGFLYISYRLYLVAKADYNEDRKRKIHSK